MTSTPALDRLLEAASAGLAPEPAGFDSLPPGQLFRELGGLLSEKNGFYALESALLLRPVGSSNGSVHDIVSWNADGLWKGSYGEVIEDVTFFAEDVFGCQFGLRSDDVVTFDPESGVVAHLADSLEGWAEALLADYENLTGYPLAHEWQVGHGFLSRGMRLVPRVPFILGGEFSIGNLHTLGEVAAMRTYAGLYAATKNVPDGSEVTFEVKNLPPAR